MTGIVPITAAIAACDRPEGLRRCLDAIMTGEALPAEVVIVDQSADDAVERMLRDSAAEAVHVRYIRQTRLGLSASRNAAIAAATQPSVAFTDDDCVPTAGWLLSIMRVLATDSGVTAVAGRVLPLGEAQPDTFAISSRTSDVRTDFHGRTVPWAVGTGGNFTARREWIERIGGFDSRLGAGSPGKAAEDADVIYRLLQAGATIRYEPDAIVWHERQTAQQRLASRFSYGYGIGAFCGLHLRRGDGYVARLLLTWLGKQGLALGRAAVQRDGFLLRQRARSIAGGVRGLFYGVRSS